MSKVGFFSYIEERMEGFEPRPDEKYNLFAAETAAFPEYYADYFASAPLPHHVSAETLAAFERVVRERG